MRSWISSAITAVLSTSAIFTQTPAKPEFEVASVRPNNLDDRIVTINVGPGGRFAARGYTLVLLMQRAYAVMDWNVTGGPSWIRSDRFDITAKADIHGNLSEAQLRPMLAKLLADRFRLKIHNSTEETFGYALQVGKGGPKLMPAADGAEHEDTFRFTNSGISGQGISMRNLARFFGGKLGLIMVDETGLPGAYDVTANWQVNTDRAPAGDDSREPLREAAIDAVQRQLGLKVVQKKVAVETLVIDHVERPSVLEN